MSAAATVGFLCLLNGAMFLGECAAYGTYWSDGQPVGLYESASGERPRLKPGAELNGLLYAISINSMGFRGPELLSEKPDNGLRIWCVGGSTTFDIFSPDDATTWPAQLGALLAEALPHRTVEVINAGIPGEILQGSAEDIQNLARAARPDLVVVYHGPNDMRQTFAGPGMGMGAGTPGQNGPPDAPGATIGPPDGGAGPGLGALMNQDLATFRVLGRLLQSSQVSQITLADRQLHRGSVEPIRNQMRDILRRIEGVGAVPVMATHALRAAPDATGETARRDVAETAMMLQMSAESAIQAFALYNQMVTEIARERRLVLADVRGAVPPDPELWGDATHFRAGGSTLAAEELARAILASDLVK